MPRVTPLTSITQIDRPAIVAEALPHLTRGFVFTIKHPTRKAVLIGPGASVALDYDQCLLHLDELEDAAYRVGSHVVEMGHRPGASVPDAPKRTAAVMRPAFAPPAPENLPPAMPTPPPAMPTPPPAMPETDTTPAGGEWLTSDEICARYPQAPKLAHSLRKWRQRGQVRAQSFGPGKPSLVLFDDAARALVEGYIERQTGSALIASPANSAAIKGAIKAEPATVKAEPEGDGAVDLTDVAVVQTPLPVGVNVGVPDTTPATDGTADGRVNGTVNEPGKGGAFAIEQGYTFSVEEMRVELARKQSGKWLINSGQLAWNDYSPHSARALAALLTRAADEAERLNAEVA